MSQNSLAKWDAVSACGPVGKPHPTPIANSGSHFPPRPSTGNGIPFLGRKLGCGFHRAPQRETASHSKGKFRDAASATPPIRKSHPTPHTSGHRTISLLGLPSIKGRPRVTKKASRTSRLSHLYCFAQRRPLNVAFVLRRTVEQGTSCPDAREDVSFRKMDRPPSAMGATPPARPFWRLQPCCPDLP